MSNITRQMLAKKNRIIPSDGRQTITWTLVRDGVETALTIANCEKRPLDARSDRFDGTEIPTDGFVLIMTEGDMTGPLAAASLSTAEVPEIGDRVTLADGTEAHLEDIKRQMMHTRHKCLCQPLREIA